MNESFEEKVFLSQLPNMENDSKENSVIQRKKTILFQDFEIWKPQITLRLGKYPLLLYAAQHASIVNSSQCEKMYTVCCVIV